MSKKLAKDQQENQPQEPVIVEEIQAEYGVIGSLTLNAEKSLNSLTLAMVHIITAQLKKWAKEPAVKAVILKGAGHKAFCAGGDVLALYQSALNPVNGICEEAESFFFHEYKLDYLIHTYHKPIICLGDGIVMGGGLGLMAGASHRVVTETSRIAMPEITIGLFPDVGSTYFLNKLPYNLGFFLALTGAQINAQDALFCRLADAVLESKTIPDFLVALTKLQWQESVDENKALITNLLTDMTPAQAAFPSSNIVRHLRTLETVCRHNSLSKMSQAILALDETQNWLEKAKQSFKQGSPLAALVIYEQLKRHLNVGLQQAFVSEYTLMSHLVKQADFKEGVRALLVDKDKQPKWHFAHTSHVPSSLLESFFIGRWEEHPLTRHLE